MNVNVRRKDRAMTKCDAENLAEKCEYGFLSLKSPDEYPYALPINYVKVGNLIYMHCAPEGKKMEAIRRDCRAMFCVVARAVGIPEKFTNSYASAMFFGKISICANDDEKIFALKQLLKKYCPENIVEGEKFMMQSLKKTAVLKFEIEAVSGKENK